MELTINIRPEVSEDAPAVRRVLEAAFKTPAEAGLVEALHANGAVSLALVAESAGEVIGHLLFSPMRLEHAPDSLRVEGLAPLAVHPEFQNQGVGTALVEAGLKRLREDGIAVVFVLGHPSYYSRFGFATTANYGIRCEFEVPAEVFMVLQLRTGALDGCSGVAYYRREFQELG